MQSTDWPPGHSQALCDLHAKGMSYGEITKEINARFGTTYTRNATLGRGKRLGLVSPATAKPQRHPPLRRGKPRSNSRGKADAKGDAKANAKANARPKTGPRRQRPGDEQDPAVLRPAVKRAPPVLRCVGISPRLVAFDALEPGDCRYPYGGDKDGDPITFCGHPRRPGSSYCPPHFDLTRDPELTERQAGPVVLRLVAAA